MRFGILGTGRITRRLVADLQTTPGVSVAVIGSRELERARWSCGQYGVANAVAGYENVIARDDVDAVYIALPPSLHGQWAIAAAVGGKHVLCEKPLATTLNEGAAIATACAQHRVRWLDATAWLHHERTEAMVRWVDEGRLGELRHLSASISFFEPFQDDEHRLNVQLGGGCLLDLGWYAVGSAILAAGPLRRVYANSLMREGVPIRTSAMLWFDNDVTATINCGYDTATRKWIEWAGTDAAIVCDDFSRPWPDRPARLWIHDRSGAVQSHQFEGSQEQRMIATLASDRDLSAYAKQALRTQAAVDAMIRSSQSERVETVACD